MADTLRDAIAEALATLFPGSPKLRELIAKHAQQAVREFVAAHEDERVTAMLKEDEYRILGVRNFRPRSMLRAADEVVGLR